MRYIYRKGVCVNYKNVTKKMVWFFNQGKNVTIEIIGRDCSHKEFSC